MCSDEKFSAVETTVQTHKLWDRSTVQQPVVLKFLWWVPLWRMHIFNRLHTCNQLCVDHLHSQKAMEDEISSLHMNAVRTLTELTKGHKA